jgi:hypothetical protein
MFEVFVYLKRSYAFSLTASFATKPQEESLQGSVNGVPDSLARSYNLTLLIHRQRQD